MKHMRGTKRVVRSIRRALTVASRRFARWWVRNDQKYRMKWRAANAFAALLIVASVAVPVIQENLMNRRYKLSQETLDLVGKNNQALASKLNYNSQKQTYEFNKEAIKEYNPVEAMQQQVGSADDKTKSLYALDVPSDPKQGVTYHDVNSQLSFKLVPQFDSLPGKTEQGRIVFPLSGGPQAVYTLKNNGLKEDIVVTDSKQETLRFNYKLDLPKSLEARPTDGGGIGIYSGDPTLFTNMSYGSDKDRELVEKARENATKTNLVFGIPAPVITAKSGNIGSAYAHFELHGDQLTVVAENLSGIKGTYSIDPSVTVTSTTEFEMGNDEGNIDTSTSGQIGRSPLTGGSLDSWIAQTSLPGSGAGSCGASARVYGVYNGYFYAVCNATSTYAKLTTSGGLFADAGCGLTWCSGTAPPATMNLGRSGFIYNGYIYLTGGKNGANTPTNATYYLKLNTNGTMGASWTPSTNLNTARYGHGAVAYNGYAYVSGGGTGAFGTTASVERAAIKADGSFDSWTATGVTALSSTRTDHVMVAYNGFMYVTQGTGNLGQAVEFAKINSDGTMGTWNTTTSVPANSPFRQSGSGIHNGYWYIVGGNDDCSGGCSVAVQQKVIYAPVLASGQIGQWQQATTIASGSGVSNAQFGVYNNYIFAVAGDTIATTVYSAHINTAGSLGSSASATTFNTSADFDSAAQGGRANFASVASSGYLYVIGGRKDNGGTGALVNTVQQAPINADGTLGTWTAGNTYTTAREYATAVAYGNSIYLIGGQVGGVSSGNCASGSGVFYCTDVQRATVNSSTGALTWSGTYTYSTTGRAGLAAVINNGYIYILGGRFNSNSSDTDEVDYAQVNADGTLGTFNTTTPMGTVRSFGIGAVAWNGRIYAVGGHSTPSIQYATPDNSTGAISSWSTASNNLTTVGGASGLDGSSTAIFNGYIYVTGGHSDSTAAESTMTQWSKIDNSTGDISSWTTSSITFSTARTRNGSVIYNGYLYVMGGCSNVVAGISSACNLGGFLKDVQYAQINNGGGGLTNSWANKGSFTTARAQSSAVAYNGYIYLTGGCTTITGIVGCTSMTNNTTYFAAISATGTLTWTALASGNVPTSRYGHAMAAYDGYLYVLGGCSSTGGTNGFCTSYLNDVQMVKINSSDGNTTGNSWVSAGSILGTARYGLSASVYNGYMYVLGGCSAVTSGNCSTFERTIEYAQINSDGSLGSWASTGGSGFTTGRFLQSAVAYAGYLYVAGGCSAMSSGNCTGMQNDVQYAVINANGTISSTWNNTSVFLNGRYGASLSARNGYMYLAGGCSANSAGACTTYESTVLTAAISSGGNIEGWWNQPGTITDPRYLHSAVIANGYLYLLGGQKTGPALLADSQGSPLNFIARVGRFSYVVDLTAENAKMNNITYNGSLADSLGNISFKVASTASPLFSTAYDAANINTSCSPGLGNTKIRYVFVTLIFDDSTGGTSGGTYGETSQAGVTDFTVRYNYIRPDPNIRLRLGQTLTGGELSPFDTCG